MDSPIQTRRLAVTLVLACGLVGARAGAQEGPAEMPEGDIVAPELVTDVEPDYPEAAMAADVEADVVLQIDIDTEGAVGEIVPLELVYYTYADDGSAIEDPRPLGLDEYGFVEAAVAAMAGYEFLPARLVTDADPAGEPIPVRVTWRVGFVIEYEETVVTPPPSEPSADSDADAEPIDPDGPVTLTGVLLVRGTREPLGGMFVHVQRFEGEASTEIVSDPDGRFEVRGLAPGEWTVSIDEVGYFPFSVEEEVVAGQITDVTYYVERNDYGEYVSTTVAEAPRREVTRRTLEVTEIQRIPGNNNDAIRVVQNLPGVARAQFGGGDVIVRGSEPQDTGFFLDGMRLPAIYHFGGLRAVVPTELLEDISFYPGGFAVDYGRATGGIIDVRTTRERPERTDGHIDVNLFDAGAYVRAPIGDRVTLELGARRSYADAVLAALSDVIPLTFTTAPRYYDYQLRLSVELSDQHTLRILGLGSDDRLDFVLDDEENLEPVDRGGIFAATWFHGVIASLESELSDTLTNELSVQAQWQAFQFEFGEEVFFDLKNRLYTFRDTLVWTPNEVLSLRYGLDIEIYPGRIRLNVPRPPKEGEEPVDFGAQEFLSADESFDVYWPAHFLGAEIAPVESLRILAGVRNEYYRPTERWGLDGRLALRWAASDLVSLKGSVSNHHQAPFFDEVSEVFGNPDLELEQAIHYVAGTEITPLEYLTIDVEGFYKDLNNLVARSQDTIVRDGETVTENFDNSGEGRVYGVEVLVRHELANNFFGWIAYTLSRSERIDPDTGDWRVFDFDQTHILTLLGSYNLPRNWSIGARFRLVTGNPTTPIVGAVYDSDADTYIRIPGRQNSDRLPAFHQLDVRVDKRWIFDRFTANLYLDIQNFYNRMNPEDLAFNYDYTESQRVTGLPLFPALGFRLEW